MRKNMKKLTVATVIGAMTVTALAPVSAQAKDKTLTVKKKLSILLCLTLLILSGCRTSGNHG